MVWAKDEGSGKIEAKPLTHAFSRQAEATLFLTFAGGERIETTPEHPFYVQGRGFVPAGLVALGNSIVTRAGPSLALEKIGSNKGTQNLSPHNSLQHPKLTAMPRLPRVVLPDFTHHFTQRGERRGDVFFEAAERLLYRRHMKEQTERCGVQVLSYCLN